MIIPPQYLVFTGITLSLLFLVLSPLIAYSPHWLIRSLNFIFIIKQDIHILLPIPGQTAGPIDLNFFVDTHWWRGCHRLKFEIFLFQKNFFFIFFIPRATPGPSASIFYTHFSINKKIFSEREKGMKQKICSGILLYFFQLFEAKAH